MAIGNTVAPVRRVSITTALFNPFHHLAGGLALALGLAILLLTAVVGFFGTAHVDGVLDFHAGRPAPLSLFLIEGAVAWLALAVPLYVAGRLLSRSRRLRAIDVFGTQALARAPYLLAALFTLLPPVQSMLAKLREAVLLGGARPPINTVLGSGEFTVFVAMSVLSALLMAWMIVLMYRAYATSCNIEGTRAVVSFVLALVVGEVLSKVALSLVLGRVV